MLIYFTGDGLTPVFINLLLIERLRNFTMVNTTLTIQDILPYGSGRSSGKKFDMDAILPYLILPGLLLIATISRPVTITVMVIIGMGALYVHSRPRQKNR